MCTQIFLNSKGAITKTLNMQSVLEGSLIRDYLFIFYCKIPMEDCILEVSFHENRNFLT